jgi:hypothetical protein
LIGKVMYLRISLFLWMHVQTKHNVYIQIQKIIKQLYECCKWNLQMNKNTKLFKLTCLNKLGGSY